MADGEIKLRIVLLAPPAGVDIGVQEGGGRDYRTVQLQRSTGGDLRFEVSVRARAGGLTGPFVHGPANGRFVYLDIGTYAGQTGTPWSRRLKIPLASIAPAVVERALADGAVLEAHVAGTGHDGGPSCGTVKPFSGWKPAHKARR